MEEIVTSLKSNKARVIKINKSEISKYRYVQRCFNDISKIQKFHTNNPKNSDNCYFGCIIKNKPTYLFIDRDRSKIVVSNGEKTSYIKDSEFENVKKILLNSSSAGHYIQKGNIRTVHGIVLYVVIAMCIALLFMYTMHNVSDGCFASIALYIMIILALRDCYNVYFLRFDRKEYDLLRKLILVFEAISILLAFTLFFVSVSESYNVYIDILGIILTISTILLKFDKPRND